MLRFAPSRARRSFLGSCLATTFGLFLAAVAGCGDSAQPKPSDRTDSATPALPAETKWYTSYREAVTEAGRLGRPILADFTGSDWCPPCIMLKKEVFDTEVFAAWAARNVVLLEVDFPRNPPLPEDQQAENEGLATKYGVEDFPTILFLNSDGGVLGKMGYAEGPKRWTEAAQEIVSSN